MMVKEMEGERYNWLGQMDYKLVQICWPLLMVHKINYDKIKYTLFLNTILNFLRKIMKNLY